MNRSRLMCVAAGCSALAYVAFSASRVTAFPDCNMLTETLGHCGEEDTCEHRAGSQSICEGTYAEYFEDTAGIG